MRFALYGLQQTSGMARKKKKKKKDSAWTQPPPGSWDNHYFHVVPGRQLLTIIIIDSSTLLTEEANMVAGSWSCPLMAHQTCFIVVTRQIPQQRHVQRGEYYIP